MTIAIPKMSKPSHSAIAHLEDVLSGKLPEEYIDFIGIHDGAVPEPNSVPIGINNESGVRRFIPVAEAVKVIAEVEGFPAAIPLGEDDCGNFFYIDQGTGGVFFWDHEIDGGDIEVAPSLIKFLEALVPFDSSAVKLQPGQVKYAWIDPSFKPEFD